MSGASSPTSSGDACAAPHTPPVEDEGVSQLQRAFFAVEQPAPQKQASAATMHRSASEPAFRDSAASWHLSMILNSIGSPKLGAQAPAGPALGAHHRRSSAADFGRVSE